MKISIVDKILKESKLSLKEHVLNIWPEDIELRKKYGQEVFDILQFSYKNIGGIHGSGFASVDDMIKNIALWKIMKRGDKITAVVMYKDKQGRKRVAAGMNGEDESRKDWRNMAKNEKDRSYSEISQAPLAILYRQNTDLEKYAMPYDEVVALNKPGTVKRAPDNDDEVVKYPKLKDFFYQRDIEGHWHTKITIGKINHSIKKD